MADFIRARSEEQKALRLAEIKAVTDRQFATRPYHEITLTTIAEELGWSRANLYKYVATKEEIFLSINRDKRDAYFEELIRAFRMAPDVPCETRPTNQELARTWAHIAAAHQDYFKHNSMLMTIIETNVSVEKLMDFKESHYDLLERLTEVLSPALGINADHINTLSLTVLHHAVGLAQSCLNNPLIKEALARLEITPDVIDFESDMEEFVLICLEGYQKAHPLS